MPSFSKRAKFRLFYTGVRQKLIVIILVIIFKYRLWVLVGRGIEKSKELLLC